MIIYYPGGSYTIPDPPTGGHPTAPPVKTTKVAGSPGLITSTGGLVGAGEALVTPVLNMITGRSYIIEHFSSIFDPDEPVEYDFRQEANYDRFPGEGRSASFHRIVLKYREIGKAKFTLGLTVFVQDKDDFVTYLTPVEIKAIKGREKVFPDFKIHTRIIRPAKVGVITGERPQVTITSDANSGPWEITKLVLCGNADEVSEQ